MGRRKSIRGDDTAEDATDGTADDMSDPSGPLRCDESGRCCSDHTSASGPQMEAPKSESPDDGDGELGETDAPLEEKGADAAP